MQLRAPSLYTMTGQVLKDHAVGVAGDRISYLLPVTDAPYDPEIIDLPHTTLLPGFVNAHCHMDLSHLREKVPYTGSFTEWIQKIVTMQQHLTRDDVQAATQELIRSGVTSVMDHVGVQSELAHIIDTPLHKQLFLEVIGVSPEIASVVLSKQNDRAAQAQRQGIPATPTPHAPYSLHSEVFEQIIQSSCRTRSGIHSEEQSGSRLKAGMTNILSIHCAESAEEWEMFVEGRGKLLEFVRERTKACHSERSEESSISDPSASPQDDKVKYSSPLQYLAANSIVPTRPWLAVHCNTLTDNDIVLLKQSRATVVHCPRSHRFFNHPPFPLERLRAAGVPVAIGTDSLASCPNFDFLEELRAMREECAFLTTEEILQMATTSSVRGELVEQPLGPSTGSGRTVRHSLSPGNFADIIGLPQQNDLLNGPVTFSMIGGNRVI